MSICVHLWYLLDHVGGQLARLRGTSSLDGVQLDYLMHHTINLLVPLGLGHGLFMVDGRPIWLGIAAAWGTVMLLITLHHDARYKAFIKRLKRVRGKIEVHGGSGDRPQPQPSIPHDPLRLAAPNRGYLSLNNDRNGRNGGHCHDRPIATQSDGRARVCCLVPASKRRAVDLRLRLVDCGIGRRSAIWEECVYCEGCKMQQKESY